jgi:hypothetical protein
MYQDNTEKRQLLEASKEEVASYFFDELNVKTYANIVNQQSPRLNLLRARDDFDEVIKVLRTHSRFLDSNNIKSQNEKRKAEQKIPVLEEVSNLFEENRITSQKHWFKFVRENKKFLEHQWNGINANINEQYGSQWKGWSYLTGSEKNSIKTKSDLASVEQTKQFLKAHGLNSQKEYTDFRKLHIGICKEMKIPASLHAYYTNRGNIYSVMELFEESYDIDYLNTLYVSYGIR